MANMPPRRILRSIVMDAISDREAFDDPSIEEETRKTIEAHRSLLLRLADDQPAMDGDTKDALALACEETPDLLMDFATLTGAARVALGTEVPALFTDDDALAEDLAAAATKMTVKVSCWD